MLEVVPGQVGGVSQAVCGAGVFENSTSETRQVMEMREADRCKTVGSDGDCGELAECSPHLVAFTLQQQQTL